MMHAPNSQNLKGIRCPECFETRSFVIQMTVNVAIEDDGVDYMSGMFDNDFFPGRVIDEEDGFNDQDPIACANGRGCGHRGTVAEFREPVAEESVARLAG